MKGEMTSDTRPQNKGIEATTMAVTPTSQAPTTHARRKKAIVSG
jgi:hypothetical protein